MLTHDRPVSECGKSKNNTRRLESPTDARLERPSELFAWSGSDEMKHYEDLFELFQLGRVHRLRSIEAGQKKSEHLYSLMQANIALYRFISAPLNGQLLPGSEGAARKLFEHVDKLFKEGIDSETQNEQMSVSESNTIATNLTSFEALLAHELSRLPAYIVEDKIGIYNVDDLVNKADEHLSPQARSTLDLQVRGDLKAAGRCLAFGLPTASGFHSMRAIEGCSRSYHKFLTGKDAADEGMPLGPIINDIRGVLTEEGGDNDTPLGLIISTLARINNIYRKPITHPEMVVKSVDDAKSIFDLAMVAISQIVENHRYRVETTQPQLPCNNALKSLVKQNDNDETANTEP